MSNPALAALFSASDDLEAEASLDADLREAHQAASLLAGPDLFLACAALLCAADKTLAEGRQAWALLDAADRQIGDLRLEYGCEEWPVSGWSEEACQLAFLFDLERTLRQRCRDLRDGRVELRRAG